VLSQVTADAQTLAGRLRLCRDRTYLATRGATWPLLGQSSASWLAILGRSAWQPRYDKRERIYQGIVDEDEG